LCRPVSSATHTVGHQHTKRGTTDAVLNLTRIGDLPEVIGGKAGVEIIEVLMIVSEVGVVLIDEVAPSRSRHS
jgi:hypothetical protein